MANWTTLKAAITDVIKTNGNQEITGAVLQNTLNSIVSAVGENATFAGIATPVTNPGTPDGPVFYLATTAGVYPNFNGLEVLDGEAVIFLWNNSTWAKKPSGFATQENTNKKLSQLGSKIDSETARAQRAESYLSKSISDEIARSKEAEEELGNSINANRYGYNVTVNGLKGGIHTIETAIKDVPSKFRMLGHKITFRTENGDWSTYHNESLSLDNYENVNDWVQEVGISSVQGDVNITNAPDYEDLTEAADGTIKFADKEYNKESFSGLGRVYLRKNIVDGVNVLTQDMMPKSNTIYIIQYDYDLQGEEITILEGCVLDFQGGTISNGKINFNGCIIKNSGNTIFSNIEHLGIIQGNYYIEWFSEDVSDTIEYLSSFFEKIKTKKLITTNLKEIRLTKGCHLVPTYTNIDFNGAEIIVDDVEDYAIWVYTELSISLSNSAPRFIKNARFIDTNRGLRKKGVVLGEGNNDGTDAKYCALFNIENCDFKYLDKGVVFQYNSYIITLYNCHLVWSNIGLYQIEGKRNFGERYSLINSTVDGCYQCGIIMQGDIYTGLWVQNSSLDNNRQEIIVKNGARVYVSNSWIESRYIGERKFTCEGQNSKIEIYDCVIDNWRGDLYDVNGNVIVDVDESIRGSQIYCNTSANVPCHGGVFIRNCQIFFFENDNGMSYDDGTSDGSAAVIFENNTDTTTNMCLNKSAVTNAEQFNKLISLDSSNAYSYVDGSDVIVRFTDVDVNHVVISFKPKSFNFKPNIKLGLEFGGNIDDLNFPVCEIYAKTSYNPMNYVRLVGTYIKSNQYTLPYQEEWTERVIGTQYDIIELILKVPRTVTSVRFKSDNWAKVIAVDKSVVMFKQNRVTDINISATRLIELLYGAYNQFNIINSKETEIESSKLVGLISNYNSIKDLYDSIGYLYRGRINPIIAFKGLVAYNSIGSYMQWHGTKYTLDCAFEGFYFLDKESYRIHISIIEDTSTGKATIKNVVTKCQYVDKFAGPLTDLPTECFIGQVYFDRTNGEPLFFDGGNWIRSNRSIAGTKNYGTFNERPNAETNQIGAGFAYYCFDKKSPESTKTGMVIYYQSEGRWIDSLGRVIDENYPNSIYGTFQDKPNNPIIGFAYFCTDRKTSEGTTNGIMIYHKGNNVWVDALGRIVE